MIIYKYVIVYVFFLLLARFIHLKHKRNDMEYIFLEAKTMYVIDLIIRDRFYFFIPLMNYLYHL